MAKQRTPVPGQTTDLAGRMNAAAAGGGGIQPAAHPEVSNPPGFGNPLKQIPEAIKSVVRLFKPKPIGNSAIDAHNRRAYEFEKAQRQGKS